MIADVKKLSSSRAEIISLKVSCISTAKCKLLLTYLNLNLCLFDFSLPLLALSVFACFCTSS